MAETEQADSKPIQDVEMVIGDDEGPVADAESGVAFSDIEALVPKEETFLDFLTSPIVEIVVGTGEQRTVLAAHQALLTKSPFLAEQCSTFGEIDTNRRIELPDENLSAMGSVLEYLYKGEYFPRRTGDSKAGSVESDPSLPSPDNTGAALLRHARVYTLADKLGMPALKSLAHAKIHRTSATAKGEIAYARYVYKETSKEDTTIRRPVAAFWARQSHVLRHEAEVEFRSMCLEFPQFGFDVLSLVLDQKEKRSEHREHRDQEEGRGSVSLQVQPGPPSGRKRARMSQG